MYKYCNCNIHTLYNLAVSNLRNRDIRLHNSLFKQFSHCWWLMLDLQKITRILPFSACDKGNLRVVSWLDQARNTIFYKVLAARSHFGLWIAKCRIIKSNWIARNMSIKIIYQNLSEYGNVSFIKCLIIALSYTYFLTTNCKK